MANGQDDKWTGGKVTSGQSGQGEKWTEGQVTGGQVTKQKPQK